MKAHSSVKVPKDKTRFFLVGALTALVIAFVAGGLLAQNHPADFPYTGVNYPAQLDPGNEADCQQFCKYAYACFYRGSEQSGLRGKATGYHNQFMANCHRNVCGKPANRKKAITCYNKKVKGNSNKCRDGANCLTYAQGGMR